MTARPVFVVDNPGNGWVTVDIYLRGSKAGQLIMPEADWDDFGSVDLEAAPPTLTVTMDVADEPPRRRP